MLLWCPSCGDRHVDVGEFATKPHHTHACQNCGMVWRPAVISTVGVQYLPGFKNERVAYHVDRSGGSPVVRWEPNVSLRLEEKHERELMGIVQGMFVTFDFEQTLSISTRWLRLVHRVVVANPPGSITVTGMSESLREVADKIGILPDLEKTD